MSNKVELPNDQVEPPLLSAYLTSLVHKDIAKLSIENARKMMDGEDSSLKLRGNQLSWKNLMKNLGLESWDLIPFDKEIVIKDLAFVLEDIGKTIQEFSQIDIATFAFEKDGALYVVGCMPALSTIIDYKKISFHPLLLDVEARTVLVSQFISVYIKSKGGAAKHFKLLTDCLLGTKIKDMGKQTIEEYYNKLSPSSKNSLDNLSKELIMKTIKGSESVPDSIKSLINNGEK